MAKQVTTIARSFAGATKGHAQVRRLSHPRWTMAKRRAFLEHLAASSNVAASAEAAGISEAHVYRMRRRDPAFNTAWREALCEGYEALEIMLLDRARHGVEQPVFYAGKQIATVRAYNDAMALRLLAMHREAVTAQRLAGAPAPVQRDIPDLDDIRAKLADMRARRAALEADRSADDQS